MKNNSMSSTTTHSMIKPSLVTQSLMKGLGVSVFESTLMYSNISSGVNRESIPDTYNIQVRNDGLVDSRRFVNVHFKELDFTK